MHESEEGESGAGNTSLGHVTVICKGFWGVEVVGGAEVNMMLL